MSVAIKDPSQVFLNILGFTVDGFSKGTFITIEQADQHFTQRKSLKGKIKVFNNKHHPYRLEFTLDSAGKANTWIHFLCKMQKEYGVAFPIPVFCKDNLGQSNFFCKAALISEPRMAYGTDNESVQWTLVCNNSSNTIGGNVQDDALATILAGISTVLSIQGAIGMDLSGIGSMAQSIFQKAATGLSGVLGGLF